MSQLSELESMLKTWKQSYSLRAPSAVPNVPYICYSYHSDTRPSGLPVAVPKFSGSFGEPATRLKIPFDHTKKPRKSVVFVCGGVGGIWTRVQKASTFGPTCLVNLYIRLHPADRHAKYKLAWIKFSALSLKRETPGDPVWVWLRVIPRLTGES